MKSSSISNFVKVIALVLMLDSVYLSIMSSSYERLVASIQGSRLRLNYTAAAMCYLLLSFMISRFVVESDSGLMDSFLLGFCTYGIFDLTSMAIFSKWTLDLALVDMVWGGILYMLVGYLIRAFV